MRADDDIEGCVLERQIECVRNLESQVVALKLALCMLDGGFVDIDAGNAFEMAGKINCR